MTDLPTTSLENKVCLVTGASRGIGRAIALALGRAGAIVVPAARSAGDIQQLAAEITQQGGTAFPQTLDVTDEEQVNQVFSAVMERIGRLDVLINNSGIPSFTSLVDSTTEEFDRVINVNLRGTYLCCRYAMKIMAKQKNGTILNISSVEGFKGYVDHSIYAASKHGVEGLTKVLAKEAQPMGIRVCMVKPGAVETDFVRTVRPDLIGTQMIQPEDIAHTVLFLLTQPENIAIDEITVRRWKSQPFA